jgi:hypothetical protein
MRLRAYLPHRYRSLAAKLLWMTRGSSHISQYLLN